MSRGRRVTIALVQAGSWFESRQSASCLSLMGLCTASCVCAASTAGIWTKICRRGFVFHSLRVCVRRSIALSVPPRNTLRLRYELNRLILSVGFTCFSRIYCKFWGCVQIASGTICFTCGLSNDNIEIWPYCSLPCVRSNFVTMYPSALWPTPTPSTSPYPEPDQSTPYHPILSFRSIIKISSHLHQCPPSCLFLSGFPTNNLNAFLFFPFVLYTLPLSPSLTSWL
jgi:hypothetical protein